MKRILLAAAMATLAASPAFAGCAEDAQAPAQKVMTLSQSLMAKLQAQAPQAEQCPAMKEVMDETQKLVGMYKGCQADLKLTDAQLQQLDQQVATGQQGYSAQCGG